ncbi:MAG TPA: zinc ribbon domain-containing protein [Gemmatimonadales bacterium]
MANLSALDPAAVHRPVRIAEIHERLVPYRTHRKALGFDSNEDYEMTLLRLFAGERGFVQVFPEEAAAALMKEATSTNPNTGLYRRFPDATVILNIEGGAPEMEAMPDEEPESLPAPPPEMAPAVAEDPEPDEREQLPFVLDESDDVKPVAQPREVSSSAPCPYCGAGLPVGRTVLFCPHCGQNIGVVHCPTCGNELDVGWQFCITCGQKVQGIG